MVDIWHVPFMNSWFRLIYKVYARAMNAIGSAKTLFTDQITHPLAAAKGSQIPPAEMLGDFAPIQAPTAKDRLQPSYKSSAPLPHSTKTLESH